MTQPMRLACVSVARQPKFDINPINPNNFNVNVQSQNIVTSYQPSSMSHDIDEKLPSVYAPVYYTKNKRTPYLKEPGCILLSAPYTSLFKLDEFLKGFYPELKFMDYLTDDQKLLSAELLVKFSGQLCYLSFSPNRTHNCDIGKYLTHIKESGHGCYADDTDVLTFNGWKNWKDITSEDLLASLSSETNEIIYCKPVALNSFYYEGPMYRVESSGVDLLVTPNHKMYVCKTTTKRGRKRFIEDYILINAEELGNVSCAYLKSGEWKKDINNDRLSKNELRLLGFSIGDGYYEGGNRINFHLRHERKINYLNKLINDLKQENLNWNLRVNSDKYTVYCPLYFVNDLARIYNKNHQKIIPQDILLEHSKEALNGLLEGLLQSDGHQSTGYCFDNTSQILIDQFQQLCLHAGFAANIGYSYGPEQRLTSYGDKILTRIFLIKRTLKPEVNKYIGQVGKSYTIPFWTGKVFCAQMPDNTKHVLYVRRNGIPVWCGNSVIEHANFSFLLYGVSRSLTHEIVRHRAGIAISQASQRFVDGKPLRFVERPEYQNDPVLHNLFEQRIEQAAEDYDKIANHLIQRQLAKDPSLHSTDDRKTDARKKVNQVARSGLPNETEAPIVITANARALRHIFEMRCNRSAEVEIRRAVFNMYQCVFGLAPNLFGDYETETLSDGTFALSTKYKKV